MDSSAPFSATTLLPENLLDQMTGLRAEIEKAAAGNVSHFATASGRNDPGLTNLAHYLALRHHDLRQLQRQLMVHGLSSLGRLESRVMPAFDAVICALAALAGQPSPQSAPTSKVFFCGEDSLIDTSRALFGAPSAHRRGRIMVTLDGEAFADPEYIAKLVQSGMDVARINCAHDDSAVWQAMADQVRAVGSTAGRDVRILMDIAGPKIRTGDVRPKKKKVLVAGDAFRLVVGKLPHAKSDVMVAVNISLPELIGRLSPGDRVLYDDGKLEGIVEKNGDGEAVVRVSRTHLDGAKLKPEKGLNFPDTSLGLSPLTQKDEKDLATVVACADMIGYSFVRCGDDIDLLEEALNRHGAGDRVLGLIAKIEHPDALKNLPELIARAVRNRPFGVMIARGDLAAEIGFERLAEMQEEILWLCEAASIPAIWATQVLENLVKTGVPTRGEMTDAAMAARAECVMLNKGPNICEAIEVLDRLFTRMDGNFFKHTPTLRALKSW